MKIDRRGWTQELTNESMEMGIQRPLKNEYTISISAKAANSVKQGSRQIEKVTIAYQKVGTYFSNNIGHACNNARFVWFSKQLNKVDNIIENKLINSSGKWKGIDCKIDLLFFWQTHKRFVYCYLILGTLERYRKDS